MFRKTVILVVAVVLLVASAFLISAQDEILLPEPTGSYDVGRTIYHLIDEDRPEILSEDEDDVRELNVFVYYPAEEPEDAVPSPYVRDELMTAFDEVLGAPDPFKSKIASVNTSWYEDAPILDSDAPYSVILFMPGFSGMAWNYTSLLQELASRGYVVFATSQPYHAMLNVFPEGNVVAGLVNPFNPPSSPPEIDPDQVLEVWTADAKFILDELVQLNENDDMLAGLLDLDQIGMVGHSMGGTTGLWMSQNDERVDAVVSLDGIFDMQPNCDLCQEMLESAIDIPLLIMSPRMPVNFGLPEEGLIADGTFLHLRGANHNTFSDDPLVWGPPTLYAIGLRQMNEINAYTAAFFDEYVKGIEGAMLEEDSDNYPDVRLLEIE